MSLPGIDRDTQPLTNAAGAQKNRDGSDRNAEVARAKEAAGRLPPGRDASRENAERAVRERWSTGG